MSSIAEQLQKYRAMNARKTAALHQFHPMITPSFTHPKTTEYFKALMQRWQAASSEESLTSSGQSSQ